MPVYDYFCQSCGKTFDKLTTFDNRNLISCPDCGAKADRKLFHSDYSFYFSPYLKELKEGRMIDY